MDEFEKLLTSSHNAIYSATKPSNNLTTPKNISCINYIMMIIVVLQTDENLDTLLIEFKDYV